MNLDDLTAKLGKVAPSRAPYSVLRAWCAWKFGWNRLKPAIGRALYGNG